MVMDSTGKQKDTAAKRRACDECSELELESINLCTTTDWT